MNTITDTLDASRPDEATMELPVSSMKTMAFSVRGDNGTTPTTAVFRLEFALPSGDWFTDGTPIEITGTGALTSIDVSSVSRARVRVTTVQSSVFAQICMYAE